MKIGDIVKNNYTTLDNPYHFLIFIGFVSGDRDCLCYDGNIKTFSKPRKDETEFLEVVGHVDFKDILLGHELRNELFFKTMPNQNAELKKHDYWEKEHYDDMSWEKFDEKYSWCSRCKSWQEHGCVCYAR